MTTPDPQGPDDRLTRLAESAQALAQEYSELARDSGSQIVTLTSRDRNSRRMIWVLTCSLGLDIALSVVISLVGVQALHNQRGLTAITSRLDTAQTVTRQKTLCPLYTLLLSAKNPAARAAYPQGPAAYDHTFAVIQEGFTALDCAQFSGTP